MARTLALVVVSFAVGALAVWLGLRGGGPGAGRAALAARPAGLDQGPVLDALARIENRLAERERVAPTAVETDDDPAFAARLDAIQRAVEELRAAVAQSQAMRLVNEGSASSSPAGEGLLALREEHPEPDWQTLDSLVAQWNRDEDSARGETLLLGYRDVIRRFGTPDEVWGTGEDLNWLYVDGIDPVSGETVREVWFQFVDGFVVQLGVKQP